MYPGICYVSYMNISQEEESSPKLPYTKTLKAAAHFPFS